MEGWDVQVFSEEVARYGMSEMNVILTVSVLGMWREGGDALRRAVKSGNARWFRHMERR